MKKPLVLCILDGCGIRDESFGNAFKNAHKPVFDFLMQNFPHTTLSASSISVGLPQGQMGNSEVGHMNIGAGRIVYQPLVIINRAIKDGSFFKNKELLKVISHVTKNKSKLHIMGLLSDGGVHSDISHLFALLDLVKETTSSEVFLHLFTDGRDTEIKSGSKFMASLKEKIMDMKNCKISTITGRYYAMDRDNNYDRLRLAYDAIVKGDGKKYSNVEEVFNYNYSCGITDEFIKPSIIEASPISSNDGIIVFNYRPDRLRELCTVITNPDVEWFETKNLENISFVSMMPINETVKGTYAFKHQNLDNTFGPYIDAFGLSQLRIAETEKYAHVTYFFDGGKEIPLKNSKRILIPSPKVATYDLKPEMSAKEITEKLIKELDKDYLDVVILNYANGDMVGHTGNYESALKAVEFMDSCLKKLYDSIESKNGTLIITADHGNCDVMINEDGSLCTTHTINKVPFIVTKSSINLKSDGYLADIAPTMLDLLELPVPAIWDGKSLIKK